MGILRQKLKGCPDYGMAESPWVDVVLLALTFNNK